MKKQLYAAVIAFVLGSCLVTLDAQGSFWTLVNGSLRTTAARAQLPVFVQLGGTTNGFPAIKRSGANILLRLADDSASATIFGKFGTSNLLISDSQPTISSGFGSTPSASIVASNGSASFTVNVGGGGAATSGVLGLPTAATGWNCFAVDQTTNVVTRMTATTTTTATLTAASAWGAQDILSVSCFAY